MSVNFNNHDITTSGSLTALSGIFTTLQVDGGSVASYTAGSGLQLNGFAFDAKTATTSASGITILSNTINSDDNKALTPKAIYDAGYVDGMGTTNYIVKWSDSDTLTSGIMYDDGTNIGIGTPSPSSKLHVVGNATFSSSSGVPVTITNIGTGNSFVVNDAAGDTTPFTINAAGWVGVGVPVPLAPLNVISANSATAQELQRWAYFANNDLFNLRLTQTVTQGVVRWTWNQTNNSTDYPNILCFDRGNVGINTTSPASRLDVNGVITVSAGTAAAPALVASGDANTGAFFPAADTFAISTAGVERLRVDASGRVGIGRTPSVSGTSLEVAGDIFVAPSKSLAFYHTNGTAGIGTPSGAGFQFWAKGDASDSIRFQGRNADGSFNTPDLLRITTGGASLGNIGIGTNSPASRLDVNGVITVSAGTAAAPALVASGDANTGAFFPAADTFAISTAGSEAVRVDSARRVGIGRTPSVLGTGASLEVNGDMYQPLARSHLFYAESYGIGTPDSNGLQIFSGDNIRLGGRSSGTFTDRLTVKSTGAVRFTPLASDPGTAAAGDVYYNSASNELRYHNGSAFVGAAPAASPAITGNATFSASSGVPVTITNTGTGNSFVVNDASGDTTPFVVDSAGIVGIQNGNPQSVAFQGLLVGAGTGGVGVTLLSSSSTNGTLAFGDDTAGNGSYRGYVQYQHASDAMAFGAAAATRVFITSSGNVGIGTGTSTPASRLEVSGVITVAAGSAAAPALVFSGDSNTGIAQIGGADSCSIVTAGVERLRVDSSGRVAIAGTTTAMLSTADDLVIGGGGGEPGMTFYGSTTARNTIAFADGTAGTNAYRGYLRYTHSSDDFRIATAATERLLIDSSGNVGIGTTSSSYKLDVNGDIGLTNGGFYTSPTGTIIGTNGWIYQSGQIVNSQGSFVDDGDAQSSQYILRTSTTNNTWTPVKNNGSDAILLASNRTYSFSINIVGRRTNGQDNAGYKLEGVLYNDGYGADFVGSTTKTVLAESDSAWDVRVSISGAGAGGSDYLLTEVLGASSKNINWVAKVDLLEVGGDIEVDGSSYTELNTLSLDNSFIP